VRRASSPSGTPSLPSRAARRFRISRGATATRMGGPCAGSDA